MAGRWTRRRSGQVLTTVRVEHHVGRDDLIGALAYVIDMHGDYPENPSATWLLDNVRDKMWAYGNAFDGTWGDLNDTDAMAQAVAMVDGAFPELRP